MGLPRRYWPGLALTGLVACSAVVRVLTNRSFQGPQLLCDEYIYADIARHFATTGNLGFGSGFGSNGFGGGPTGGGSLFYPLLIAPAWLAHRMSTVFGLAKAINAVIVSLTAVPVYLWARRTVSPAWALVAAGLVLLMTGFVLSGMLMSENAALPVFVLALFAIGLAVEEPTLPRQGFVLVGLILAYAVRTQGLVLVAILPAALLLDAVLDLRAGLPRSEPVRRLWRLAPLGGALALALLFYLARSGFSPGHAIGFYRAVATTHYDLSAVLVWTARYAGEAALALGVAPFFALVLLLLTGLTRGFARREERAFVATATAAVAGFLVQAGMYSSAFNPSIIERYSMYAFPPLVIALVVLLAGQRLRPLPETLAAATLTLSFVSVILFSHFLEPELPSPSVFARLTLYFFTRIPQHVPGGLDAARVLLLLLAAAAVGICAFAPIKIARVVLPAGTALLLLLASHSAHAYLAANTRTWIDTTGPVRSWIDDAIGTAAGSADYLYVPNPTMETSSTVLVNTRFWNRSIGNVYTLGGEEICPLRLDPLRVDDQTGAIVADDASARPRRAYLVTDRGLAIAGRLVASGGSTAQPLAVYRPARPLRLASRLEGVYADGWTGADASFFQYWLPRPNASHVDVSLSRIAWSGPDVPATVKVSVRALHGSRRVIARAYWVAHSGAAKTLRLRAPSPPFEVAVHVAPTFSPAQFGSGDSRQLGVQLAISSKNAR
jgi:hypothetical protein